MPDVQVLGVVPNRSAAEQVVGNLRLAGYEQQQVSLIIVKPEEAAELDEQATDLTGEGAKDVAGSAAKGAAIGGATGVAAGLATLAIPGIGPILGTGILLGLFGGAGTFVGALSGAFASEDTSNQVVERYGMALREGQAIICVTIICVTVPDNDAAKQAEEVLNAGGASNVQSYMEDVSPLTKSEGVEEVDAPRDPAQ
jgi:hypothetical protein